MRTVVVLGIKRFGREELGQPLCLGSHVRRHTQSAHPTYWR